MPLVNVPEGSAKQSQENCSDASQKNAPTVSTGIVMTMPDQTKVWEGRREPSTDADPSCDRIIHCGFT
jgi:hypothetical protein